MKSNSLIALGVALLTSAGVMAQDVEPLDPVKPMTYFNPLCSFNMCADPTAIEYEGRIYVYGSNDQQEYDGANPGDNNTYGRIKSLVMLSSADMVNWTFHGTIDMAKICGNWMATSWAPSIVSRVEDDGLTHFYMYFSNSGGGVGVVTATSPVGPWTAPLNRSLISGSTPGLGKCTCPFDPGVVIDDNGVGWLTFGGLDPVPGGTSIFPGNSKIVRLGKDMISLDSEIVTIPAPYQFEASELNYINGKYVYTYCSSWSDRNAWSSYKSNKPAPSTCSMCYMTSDDPLNPDSWVYGGEVLKNPGAFGYPWGNNHTHMHKFNGNWYMFYHTQVMENLAGIKGGYRTIGVNQVNVDEENVVISPVTLTNSGVKVLRENSIVATERNQAETMWNGVGFKAMNFKTEGNTNLTDFKPGAWIGVRNVQFGSEPVTTFTAKLRGKIRMQIKVGNLNNEPVGELYYTASSLKDYTIRLDQPITGQKTVYFVITESTTSAKFDEWQFGYDESGINDIVNDASVVSEEYFSLDGRRVSNPAKGMYIRRTTMSDGSVLSDKVIR